MPNIDRKIVVGLTGGIASGKSTVLKTLKRLGCKTLDSDRIARKVVRPGQPALLKIRRAFGNAVFSGRNLNRRAMADLIFQNASARKKLESIVHPEVIKHLKRGILGHKRGVLVIDIPLLFEAKLQNLADRTVLVWAPEKIQIKRLMKRNRLTLSQARARLRSQMPIHQKKKLADFIIDNSSSPRHAERQIRGFLRNLTSLHQTPIISAVL